MNCKESLLAYKEAVTVDSSRNHNFVVGELNGDGSQDIAIVVKLGKGMLPELNSEYANWIREGGKLAAHAHEQQSIKNRKPIVVTARDNLLVVGYQAAGWRDPRLLKLTYSGTLLGKAKHGAL